MCDDVKTQAAIDIGEAPARNLRRIADALGMLPSDFFGSSLLDREGLTLLALVQAYLVRVDPETRERFTRAVQAMDASPPSL